MGLKNKQTVHSDNPEQCFFDVLTEKHSEYTFTKKSSGECGTRKGGEDLLEPVYRTNSSLMPFESL